MYLERPRLLHLKSAMASVSRRLVSDIVGQEKGNSAKCSAFEHSDYFERGMVFAPHDF